MLRFLPAICILAQLAIAADPTTIWRPSNSEESENFVLKCAKETDETFADSCDWIAPVLKKEKPVKHMKIDGVKGFQEEECWVEIETFKPEFYGNWSCRAYDADDNEFVRTYIIQEADLSTSIAMADKSREIDNSTDTLDYECQVDLSTPEPKFSWFIDDEPAVGYETSESVSETKFSGILKYIPQEEDVNKTLKCVASWESYDGLNHTLESSVTLNITDVQIATISANQELKEEAEPSTPEDETDLSVTIVGIFLGIAFGCALIAIVTTQCYRLRNAKKPDIIQDEETGSGTTEEEETKAEEEEKKDEPEKQEVTTETATAAEKKSRFEFLTKFFKRDAVADKAAETTEEKAVKMADVQSTQEEKPQEFEPETKPEQVTQEEAAGDETAAGDKKSEPTPNTSF